MKRRFYPSLDRLEDRTVPAGNVTVNFHDGILRVLGDAEDNQISIIGDGRGNVTITGHEDTTINGRESIRVSGVKKGLEVWMRGGDDTVTISNLQLKRNAFIHMGDGDDVLNISHLKTKRSTEIWAGEGNDQINVVGSKFRRGFVSGGTGEDIVNLVDNYFGRKSIIGGGADFDTLGGLNNTLKKKTQVVGFEETVNGVIPTGQPDQATVNEGGSVVINVAANDSTFRGTLDLSSIVIVQNPLHGTVQVNGDGTVTYTHNGSETTSDNFQYVISNSFGNTSLPIDVFLTINPVNDAPIANNDAATLSEGGTIDINVALNDVDPEGALDLTSITIVTQPVNGTVVVNNNGTVTYTHNGSQTTSDSFTYTIRDTSGLVSNIATVSITILAVNNPPVANDDEATVDEGASVQIDVAANDTDVDGTIDLTSIIIIDQPAHGTVTVNLDGSVTYTHDGSETTSDSFTYTIRDNQGAVSNVATVNIIINPVNDAPVAVDDEVTVETGTTTIIGGRLTHVTPAI
ncbi:MAG TPA: Ig-like domain-containing protein, partial [Gemmatales bacterium]|nr:Ig-like domain-containing protein [Gemmatales bacterium]